MQTRSSGRSISDTVAATILASEFRRVKDELESSRAEAPRASREHEETREKLEMDKRASLAKASECGVALGVAREVADICV